MLSIITINYNNKSGLEKTIQSVIDQTFSNVEYIVIDGGSSDGSTDVINQYKDKIQYWVSEPDSGVYHAQNKGIRVANGQYVLFLNSGDVLADDTVLDAVFQQNIQEDIVYGNLIFDYGKGHTEVKEYPENLRFSYFIDNGHLPHPAAFIKRNLFDVIGLYNEHYKISSDWEFFLKAVFLYNATYARVNVAVSIFNVEGLSSRSENLSLIAVEKEQILTTYFRGFIKDYKDYLTLRNELSSNIIIKALRKLKLIRAKWQD